MSVMQRVGVNGDVVGRVGIGVSGKGSRKPVGKPRKGQRSARARWWTTVALGCGVPALSLSLSSIGGRLLAEGHGLLGSCGMVLCCTVLGVSLSHLAWAIGDITKAKGWQPWALAMAIDASLVLGELSQVYGFESVLVPVVMASVAVMSAWLNCWAFLRHCA